MSGIRIVTSFRIPKGTVALYKDGALVAAGPLAMLNAGADCDEFRIFPSDHDNIAAAMPEIEHRHDGTFLPRMSIKPSI
jgi:hypothetical protein